MTRRSGPLGSVREATASRLRDPRGVEPVVLAGLGFALLVVLVDLSVSASHPGVAIGTVLQLFAGLLTATRLWANSANEQALAWGAKQIASNRFGLARLLDGSLLSHALSTAWLCAGIALAQRVAWPPESVVKWALAIVAILIFWSGAALYMASMSMFTGRMLLSNRVPRRDRPLRRLAERVGHDDRVWTVAGVVFLAGTILQLAAA